MKPKGTALTVRKQGGTRKVSAVVYLKVPREILQLNRRVSLNSPNLCFSGTRKDSKKSLRLNLSNNHFFFNGTSVRNGLAADLRIFGQTPLERYTLVNSDLYQILINLFVRAIPLLPHFNPFERSTLSTCASLSLSPKLDESTRSERWSSKLAKSVNSA